MCGNHLRGQDPQEHTIESFQCPAILGKGIRVSVASISQWLVTHRDFWTLFSFLQQVEDHNDIMKDTGDEVTNYMYYT